MSKLTATLTGVHLGLIITFTKRICVNILYLGYLQTKFSILHKNFFGIFFFFNDAHKNIIILMLFSAKVSVTILFV